VSVGCFAPCHAVFGKRAVHAGWALPFRQAVSGGCKLRTVESAKGRTSLDTPRLAAWMAGVIFIARLMCRRNFLLAGQPKDR
jgi:hypothetical protein